MNFHLRYCISCSIVLLQFILMSCDYCVDVDDSGKGKSEQSIYFNSVISNDAQPEIFSSNEDGSEIFRIAGGLLFSSPSNSGVLAFSRISDTQQSSLWLANTDGSNEQLLEVETSQYTIATPVISSTGKFVAFYGGSSRMFIYEIDNSVVNYFPNNFDGNTIPSFSPDGLLLAYFELVSGIVELKVKPTNDFSQTMISRKFESLRLRSGIRQRINWSANGRYAVFSLESDTTDILIVMDAKENSFSMTEISKTSLGAFSPNLSPEGDYIVFTANNGSLWLLDMAKETQLFTELTVGLPASENLNPAFSPDGQSILFLSKNEFTAAPGAILIKMQLENDGTRLKARNYTVISNNALTGFWGKI